MPTRLEDLTEIVTQPGFAQSLQGMSAGLQGNLPQFQQAQNQKKRLEMIEAQNQQAQELERRKTVFIDAARAKNLLEAGDLDGVVALGLERMQILSQIPGVDMGDTRRVTNLAIAARNGDEEALKNLTGEINSTIDIGQQLGVLKAPEPDKLNIVQWVKPDGSTQSLNTDDFGNFFDMTGEQVSLPADARILESATISGTPDEYGLSDREGVDLDNKEIATRNMISLAGDAISMLEEMPDINTLTARGASLVNNVQQEFSAVARS
jgi:hypothetical protein